MSIDSMRRLRVVLANGHIVDVTEQENADLWWGIRGAGQNFGVVVEADFQTSPQVPQGLYYDVEMTFSDDKLEAVLALMNQQINNQPAELAVNIIFGANATTIKVGFLFNPFLGRVLTRSNSQSSPSILCTQDPSPPEKCTLNPGNNSVPPLSSKRTTTGQNYLLRPPMA